MKITVNGEAVHSRAATLADLLAELGQGEARVATAVNEDFVPAARRGAHTLCDGDRVEIVAPRQGG